MLQEAIDAFVGLARESRQARVVDVPGLSRTILLDEKGETREIELPPPLRAHKATTEQQDRYFGGPATLGGVYRQICSERLNSTSLIAKESWTHTGEANRSTPT